MATTSAIPAIGGQCSCSASQASPMASNSPIKATTRNRQKFLLAGAAEKLHNVLTSYEKIVATQKATPLASGGLVFNWLIRPSATTVCKAVAPTPVSAKRPRLWRKTGDGVLGIRVAGRCRDGQQRHPKGQIEPAHQKTLQRKNAA